MVNFEDFIEKLIAKEPANTEVFIKKPPSNSSLIVRSTEDEGSSNRSERNLDGHVLESGRLQATAIGIRSNNRKVERTALPAELQTQNSLYSKMVTMMNSGYLKEKSKPSDEIGGEVPRGSDISTDKINIRQKSGTLSEHVAFKGQGMEHGQPENDPELPSRKNKAAGASPDNDSLRNSQVMKSQITIPVASQRQQPSSPVAGKDKYLDTPEVNLKPATQVEGQKDPSTPVEAKKDEPVAKEVELREQKQPQPQEEAK